MLKFNYTDLGLFLEQVNTCLEALIADRVLLAVRLGATLHVEAGRAAFLLPVVADGIAELDQAIRQTGDARISLSVVDAEFVEVSLHGTWIADRADAHEGIFVAAVGDRIEFFICKLWQATQAQASGARF